MGLDKSKNASAIAPSTGWILPLGVLSLCLVIALLGDGGREFLRYDRFAIGQGDLWRLISGHLSHLGWPHFALNAAGLALVWTLVGKRYSTFAWLLIVGISLITIDLGFWYLRPDLSWYVGLSGLLHGVLAAGLLAKWDSLDAETLLLAILLLMKLAWEQFGGALPGSATVAGGPVVVAAHLYGTVGGLLGALLVRIRVRPTASI